MKVGAGNAQIVLQKELFPLEGFYGIHDLPKVSVLIIDDVQKVAVVSVEMVMLWDDLISQCKKAVEKLTNTPIGNVWIHVTHAITTPHAPGGPQIGLGGEVTENKSDSPETELLQKRVCYENAVMQALQTAAVNASILKEAKLFVGTGCCDLIRGRDIETPNGWWIGTDGAGESNETMTVLGFRDTNSDLIAALISYGMKPCVIDNSEMDKGKRLVSADAPGLCCRELENILGATILYCTAAAGDRVPLRTAWYDQIGPDGWPETVDLGVEKGIAFARELGHEMAQAAMRIIKEAEPDEVHGVSHKTGKFVWETKERSPMRPYKELAFKKDGWKEVPVEVISLGNVALVAGKPEINALTERQLQERSRYSHTLYLSMVNGGMKYMPDQDSYRRISWEAQASMFLQGAAEMFVDTAIKLMEEN